MLKDSEVGKRRLKHPCGRTEFQMRKKLREGRGKYEYQINDRNAVFHRPRGHQNSEIDSRMFRCARIFNTAMFQGD
jgi:hypothetical protein